MTSAIAYRGPSLLDSSPIVLVVTGLGRSSMNRKTGAMIQTYILRDTREAPVLHVKRGTDASICGDCKFAGGNGCYVNVGQGPHAIHGAIRRGSYLTRSPLEMSFLVAGKSLRLGSYGDPAAVSPRAGHRAGASEILCPASAEAGHRTTCDRCGLCSGARPGVKDIFIPAHGSMVRRAESASGRPLIAA
jgi:hypothetical protein